LTASRPLHRPLLAATLATAALLAGCATPIARSVVQANLAQEQAANQLLLLNIARAHERMPMHFSQIGQIRAAPGGWGLGTPSLGLSLPFGGAAKPEYTLTAGTEGASPVDVSALTSQEFMRGITTPVGPDLLAYLLNQGWPPAMLMHLFLESVTTTDDKGGLRQSRNDPGRLGYADFRHFVDQAVLCELAVKPQDGEPSFLSSPVSTVSMRDGVEAAKAKLQIVEQSAAAAAAPAAPAAPATPAAAAVPATAASAPPRLHYRLAQVDSEVVLQLQPRTGTGASTSTACPPPSTTDAKSMAPQRKLILANSGPALAPRRGGLAEGAAPLPRSAGQSEPKPGKEAFVLRSPQSMLYYLGQLSRAQNGGWLDGEAGTGVRTPLRIKLPDGQQVTLFDMVKHQDAIGAADAAVAVTYGRHTFAVRRPQGPGDKTAADRSTQVLALMQLILGLQDKGTEAPGASSVRLVR